MDEEDFPPFDEAEVLRIIRKADREKQKKKAKLALECTICILVMIALMVIYDLLYSPWMALALAGCGGLFICNKCLGYVYLGAAPHVLNVRRSFRIEHARMMALVFLNRASIAFMIVAGILIPYSSHFGPAGMALWCIVVCAVVGVTWRASKPWSKKAVQVQNILKNLKEPADDEIQDEEVENDAT